MFLKLHIKSKGKDIKYYELERRNYLKTKSLLRLQEKKEAFIIRTRMTELKTNLKNKYDNLNCDLCEKKNKIKEETQEHIYACKHLKENK